MDFSGNEKVINLDEQRRAMMHGLLDEILDAGYPGPIQAILLNLKAHLSGVEQKNRLKALEEEIRELREIFEEV